MDHLYTLIDVGWVPDTNEEWSWADMLTIEGIRRLYCRVLTVTIPIPHCPHTDGGWICIIPADHEIHDIPHVYSINPAHRVVHVTDRHPILEMEPREDQEAICEN